MVAVALSSPEAVASVVLELTIDLAVLSSSALGDRVSRAMDMTAAVALIPELGVGASAGRITTSLSETVMLALTSRPNGLFWKRLITIAWAN